MPRRPTTHIEAGREPCRYGPQPSAFVSEAGIVGLSNARAGGGNAGGAGPAAPPHLGSACISAEDGSTDAEGGADGGAGTLTIAGTTRGWCSPAAWDPPPEGTEKGGAPENAFDSGGAKPLVDVAGPVAQSPEALGGGVQPPPLAPQKQAFDTGGA
mmetsp:Transcript_87109/g.242520  ORF Transcript_87109/g.242520 Transcript_87109/m.242520 type:complete len:156 (-) Transcript_87109:198-665(-)